MEHTCHFKTSVPVYVGIVTLELGANELVFRGKCVSSVTRKSIDLYIYVS